MILTQTCTCRVVRIMQTHCVVCTPSHTVFVPQRTKTRASPVVHCKGVLAPEGLCYWQCSKFVGIKQRLSDHHFSPQGHYSNTWMRAFMIGQCTDPSSLTGCGFVIATLPTMHASLVSHSTHWLLLLCSMRLMSQYLFSHACAM